MTALLAVYTSHYTSYQGSKASVEWFSKSLSKAFSKALMDRKISVDAIAPGPMDTPFLYPQESDDIVAFFQTMALEGRLAKIEDVVPIVKFLCTDGAWINGKTRRHLVLLVLKSCRPSAICERRHGKSLMVSMCGSNRGMVCRRDLGLRRNDGW